MQAKKYNKSRVRLDGSVRFRRYCNKHERVVYDKKHKYKSFKKPKCEKCGFMPTHSCQLDVDHIDGNKSNVDEANLQTLCANCHRLKTHINEDWA